MGLGFSPRSFLKNLSSQRSARRNSASSRGKICYGFEALEPRRVMAADMAEIVGAVRLDLQGDGNPANDTLLQAAAISLYRDGVDGAFNNGGGDDSLVAEVVTDSQGRYRITGLSAGKYFVKLNLPATLQAKAGGDVKEITITAAEAEGAKGPFIDGFTTKQRVEAAPPLPKSEVSSLLDPAVLGGERDMYVELTAGSDEYSSVSLTSGGGLMRLASDTMVTGNAKIVWDGADGSANSINYDGLGGVNFATHLGNTMTGVRLRVGADHADSVVTLRLYTDATHWSEFVTTVPETAGGAATKQVTFNFDSASSVGPGGGADFSKVGAIELTFEGVSAVDGQVSVADVIGLTTKTADFTAYNRLSLGDMVWNDVNNNGKFEPGENGIGGVKLNLYRDVDGNGTFTSGVDTAAGTATTDASGIYMFKDLLPGGYIVQVDPSNFDVSKPLHGKISSLGNASAADPDNDVDGDDNGAPLAGFGVVSAAISLTGGGEPTTDGDGPDSNRTVDFGFYGFDLVLVKEADKLKVSPLETLTYTVTIRNDGPSTAMDVQFLDTLPVGVTVKDIDVTKPGVNLVHSGGKITGSLGTMVQGDEIVVTVAVQVLATAIGDLYNEAEVSAPNEFYVLNNRDDEKTPITPKIDLQIDKSDSEDPVKPEATFSYTLAIKNNGPSNATEVKILDTLPSDVIFVNASMTNVSTKPGQLQFDVGNLATGATAQVIVTVKVKPGFVGLLTNETEVRGKEEEITYENNKDKETTLVKVDPASISGHVYVDRNNNGKREAGEAPIANVVVTLTGNDFTGKSVHETTKTDAAGFYKFANLQPGTYHLTETHPTGFKDGLDSLGDNGDGLLTAGDGLLALDTVAGDDRDADAFESIALGSGFNGLNYDFGELAVTPSKIDFIQRSTRR